MRFTDYVNIPDELVNAHLTGKLVFFAGAGVSISPPSGLPSFHTLTENICAKLSTTLSVELGKDLSAKGVRNNPIPYDQILEKLEKKAPIIRDIVRSEIELEGSMPNRLHNSIFKLANLKPEPKIVTTNFDSHFNNLNRESGGSLREYAAPALPLGRSFKGIVQIHGSTSPNFDSIILTRRDFGAAYLVDGWARDFLYEMFREYVVLFVGYSHDDLMLDYFARGMSGEKPRYILINSEEKRDWTELGIIPIYYPLTETGEHIHLEEAMESWERAASSGASETKNRLVELSQNPVFPLPPSDHDFLVHALKAEASSIYFYSRADFLNWSKWIEEQGLLDGLFSTKALAKEFFPLLDWFARGSIASQESSSAAFNMIAGHAGTINPWLWNLLVETFSRDHNLDQTVVDRWISWLILDIPESRGDALSLLLLKYHFSNSPDVTLQLFTVLTKLKLDLSPSYQRDTNVGTPPSLQIDDGYADNGMYWVEEFWNREKNSLPSELIWKLIWLIHEHLETALLTFQGFYGDANAFHSLATTLGYFALQDQEFPRITKLSILADVAVVGLKGGFQANATKAAEIIKIWMDSEFSILQNIALLVASNENSYTASEVAGLFVQRDLLLDHHLYNRNSEFLQMRFDVLTSEMKAQIIVALKPTSVDDERTTWMKGRLAVGIFTKFPNELILKPLVDSLVAIIPDLANNIDSDFHRGRVRIAKDEPLRSVDDFMQDILADSSKVLVEIMEVSRNQDHFQHPNINDVTFTLSECVRRRPETAQVLWYEVDSLPDQNLRVILLSALLEPFESICAQGNSIGMFLELIKKLTSTKLLERTIARVLLEIVKPWERNLNMEFEVDVHEILKDLVKSHDESHDGVKGGSESYSEVINDFCDNLVELYLRLFQAFAPRDDEGHISIDQEYLLELSGLLEGSGGHHDLRYSRLALSIQFLIQLTPDWVVKHLLPRLLWEVTDSTTLATWSGFLHAGLKADWLISHDIMLGYQRALSHKSELQKDQYVTLVQRIAWLASFTSLATNALSWITPMVISFGGDSEFMTQWNNAIERILQANEEPERERIWSLWLGTYVSDRLKGLPMNASKLEKSEIACWVPHMRTHFLDLIALILNHPGPLSPDLELRISADEESIFKDHPSESIKFVTALLCETDGAGPRNYGLVDFARELKALVTPDEYRIFINTAASAGYFEAPEWNN